MNVGRKLMLIVVTSLALVTLPSAGAIYYYVKQDLLKKEANALVAETKSLVSTNTSNLIKAEFSLKSLSRSLVKSLAAPPEPGEIAAFNGLIQHDIDGAWRSRRNNFDGEFEAGMFFPADAPLDIAQKILHLRSKRIMDVLAGSISAPFSNLWLLTPGRTEVIYDRGVKDFVMQMAADTDYTKTPWMMLGDPATNPDRVMLWTPPLFDPVPKSWMVSAVLPVDVNGIWIGNIGHDLYLKTCFLPCFSRISITLKYNTFCLIHMATTSKLDHGSKSWKLNQKILNLT